jgi:hypothetical protein
MLVVGIASAVVVTLAGPRWRGNFYRSWLKPRLVAFGIIVVVLATASYLYRVVNALHTHG